MNMLLTILNYFESLQRRRGDDPLVAQWKAKQRGVWVATACVMVVDIVLLAMSSLDGVGESAVGRVVFEQFRLPALYLVTGAIGGASLYCAFVVVSTLRFGRRHGFF